MENVVQIYLPLAGLLFILINSVILKKSCMNWAPIVLLLAGIGLFLGKSVVSNDGNVPGVVVHAPIFILILATLIAIIYRKFLKGKGKKIQILVLGLIYVLTAAIVLMIQGNFTSGMSVFNGQKLIFPIVVNAIFVFVILWKLPFLNKILKLNATASLPVLLKASLYIIVAIAIFFGVFLTGWYGVAVFASVFIPTLIILSNDENENMMQQAALSIVAILGIVYISAFAGDLTFELIKSHLIWGALIVGFLLMLGELVNLIGDRMKILPALVSILVVGLIFVLGFLYNIKESLGGVITYSGALIGVALMVFNTEIKSKFSFSLSNGIMITASVLLFSPMFVVVDPFADKGSNADKLEGEQKKVEVVNDKGEKVVLEMNDITEAKGEWEIFLDNSKLKFTVISHGDQTKGTFKNYSGTVKITDDLKDCEVNLVFDATSISTFNKTRDKEVKGGSEWMDVSKFAELTYHAKGFRLEGEKYITEGELNMKGITKSVAVEFVFDGKGNNDGKDFVIISGSLNIEMTNFGIPESSEVDKGVAIEFTIEANKME